LIDYCTGDAIYHDVADFHASLRKDIEARVPLLKTWEYRYGEGGGSHWSPEKWKVCKGGSVDLVVCLSSPFDKVMDERPSVGIAVPAEWRRAKAFREKSKALLGGLKGFKHISDPGAEDWDEGVPVSKYVDYEKYLDASSGLDTTKFSKALATELKNLIACQTKIDALIKASSPKKKAQVKN
jgi:hypothetical protein